MGLCKWQSPYPDARILAKSDDAIQALDTKQNPKFPALTHCNPIRGQDTICHRQGSLPPPQQRRDKIYSSSGGHPPVLCKSS